MGACIYLYVLYKKNETKQEKIINKNIINEQKVTVTVKARGKEKIVFNLNIFLQFIT